MYDSEVRREIFDRVGESATDKIDRSRIPEGIDPADPTFEAALDPLWTAWVDLTYTLFTFGLSHRTLCDAAGQMVPVHEEATERQAAER